MLADERRQIVSFGGGGFSMEAGNPLLDDYVLGLCEAERPRVCFLPTASGDADHYLVRFYRHFSGDRCIPSHVSLFRKDRGADDLRAHLLSQDLIYVGGGSVISLLATWRAHGVDLILRDAWKSGVVLCGLSAGSLCWFAEGVTSFHGPAVRFRGLGLLPWSNCVHYGNEAGRREDYHAHLRRGMCPGYAASDGAALHFRGHRLAAVVGSRPDARAWTVGDRGAEMAEQLLPVRYLGAEEAESVPAEARKDSAEDPDPPEQLRAVG
ncbi:MAG: Type 1 glutamine amidotransferase-like domain-containing protein [Solirubrobacterales bacterium]